MKTAILAVLLAISVSFSETVFRLPVRTTGTDSSVARMYTEAIDSVFRDLPGRNYTVIAAENPDSFPADSNVCTGTIDTVNSDELVFSLDFYFAGTSADSAWSCSFNLPHAEISKKLLISSIIKLLQSNGFPGLFLSRIQIVGASGAEVLIDSAVTENKVPFEKFLPSGEYLIEIRKNWLIRDKFIVDLAAGKDTAIVLNFWKKTARLRYSLFAATALCAGAGLYLNYYQNVTYDKYLLEKQDADRMERLYRRYQYAVVGRNSFLVMGGSSLIFAAGISIAIPF